MKKILLIDDEEMVRETIAGYLEDYDFEVIKSVNGKDGLEKFTDEGPDAVLVDLWMPVMDGLDVLRHICKESPEIPIVVISGTNDIDNVVEAQRLGAWDYVTKPIYDLELLLQILNNVLEKANLLKENTEYKEYLEDMVKKRTSELTDVNEKLKSSIKEKDILLKEIHHRVKNNMQVISSLMDLQAKFIEDDNARKLFINNQSRIRSMAIVHERLYQSSNLSSIDFEKYVIDLASELGSVYFDPSKKIKINVNIKKIVFGLDLAVPCGLILNELVSNSLKYAFKEKEAGEININLINDNDDYTLTVSDDGNGMPENFDITNTGTLGMELINALTIQINGSIDLDISNGTKFIIKFKNNIKSKM